MYVRKKWRLKDIFWQCIMVSVFNYKMQLCLSQYCEVCLKAPSAITNTKVSFLILSYDHDGDLCFVPCSQNWQSVIRYLYEGRVLLGLTWNLKCKVGQGQKRMMGTVQLVLYSMALDQWLFFISGHVICCPKLRGYCAFYDILGFLQTLCKKLGTKVKKMEGEK